MSTIPKYVSLEKKKKTKKKQKTSVVLPFWGARCPALKKIASPTRESQLSFEGGLYYVKLSGCVQKKN